MSDEPKKPWEEAPARNDLDLGLQFAHLMGMQTRFEAVQALGAVYALIEDLAARNLLDLREFEKRRKNVTEREAQKVTQQAVVQLAEAPDKYSLTQLPVIDCEALLPLCQARCCTMGVTLARQDLDERVIRWEYAQPYQIRRRKDGYCTHNDEQTRACQVHANRPATCRLYDCRNDKRIWLDFENRIPAAGPEPSLQTEKSSKGG